MRYDSNEFNVPGFSDVNLHLYVNLLSPHSQDSIDLGTGIKLYIHTVNHCV